MPLLKFNNIRDLSDARFASAAMAEWIGFTLGEADSLPADKIQEIISWCAGPKLILEISDDVATDVLRSYLDVLPADGLELSPLLLKKFASNLDTSAYEIILTAAADLPDSFTGFVHLHKPATGLKTIVRVNPENASAAVVKQMEVEAISLSCVPSENPALKNYDTWISFLEELEEV